MDHILEFKNDFFFKYYAGRNNFSSMSFRHFLLQHILIEQIEDVRVDNPELFVVKHKDKHIFLDTFMSHDDNIRVGMEMQKSQLNAFLRKRFQYYAFKAVVTQLMNGEKDYDKLKEYHQVILIDDEDKRHHSLVTHACIHYEDGDSLRDCIVYIDFVNLRYARRLAQEKETLNEFEAVIYFMSENTLENIHYEEKEGMVSYMERMYEQFRGDGELMSVVITEGEKRKLAQMELAMEKEEAHEAGRYEKTLKIVQRSIIKRYQVEACKWVETLSEEQLDEVLDLMIEGIDYDDLQKKYIKS